MESYNGPPVRPPNPGDKKKAEGSFARRNNWVIIIIIAVLLLVVAGWFAVRRVNMLKLQYSTIHLDSTVNDDDSDTGTLKVDTAKTNMVNEQHGVFIMPYVATGVARLNISGGAATYRLDDTTSQLFYAVTKAVKNHYEFDSHTEDSVYVMDFSLKKTKEKWDWNKNFDTVGFKLNVKPEWEINVEAGAVDLNFDLSKYKLKSLKVNGGAGQFVMKVGQPLKTTNIIVSTGVSDVTIEVPQNAACRIELTTNLSSNILEGFTKKSDRHYETAGFDKAKNKIYIQFTGAISDFKVHKY
jgi:hypothetical protein